MVAILRKLTASTRQNPLAGADRLWKDRGGASAVEFVIIFPIMLLLLAGTIDLGQALMVSRKMNQIVATLGDMIAQKSAWSSDDAQAIMTGASTIIQPFSQDELGIQLAIVDVDKKQHATVNWSKSLNSKSIAKGDDSPVETPATVAQPDVQLVVVNATYRLTTPFSSLLVPVTGTTSYYYSRSYLIRPRITDSVELKTAAR